MIVICAILATVTVLLAYSNISNRHCGDYDAQAILHMLALSNKSFYADNNKYITSLADVTASLDELGKYGFRSDYDVAFDIVPLAIGEGFVAYAAHKSVGSIVFYYDSTSGEGVKSYTAGASRAAPPTADYLFIYTSKRINKTIKYSSWSGVTFTRRGAPLAAIAADPNYDNIFKVTADQ